MSGNTNPREQQSASNLVGDFSSLSARAIAYLNSIISPTLTPPIDLGAGTPTELILDGADESSIGDINGFGNGTALIINDATEQLTLRNTGGVTSVIADEFQARIAHAAALLLSTDVSLLGDAVGVGNGTLIEIDDTSQRITLNAPSGLVNINAPLETADSASIGLGTASMLFSNGAQIASIGDVADISNSTKIIVDDSAQEIDIQNSGNVFIKRPSVNGATFGGGFVNIGDVTGGGNNTQIIVEDGAQSITLESIILMLNSATISMPNIPLAPGATGELWNNGGVLQVSP